MRHLLGRTQIPTGTLTGAILLLVLAFRLGCEAQGQSVPKKTPTVWISGSGRDIYLDLRARPPLEGTEPKGPDRPASTAKITLTPSRASEEQLVVTQTPWPTVNPSTTEPRFENILNPEAFRSAKQPGNRLEITLPEDSDFWVLTDPEPRGKIGIRARKTGNARHLSTFTLDILGWGPAADWNPIIPVVSPPTTNPPPKDAVMVIRRGVVASKP